MGSREVVEVVVLTRGGRRRLVAGWWWEVDGQLMGREVVEVVVGDDPWVGDGGIKEGRASGGRRC
jgi:hypothetical protein